MCMPCTVYPRVCGGTFFLGAFGVDAYGLSPRVRGNQYDQPLLFPLPRSIPACAGEPWECRGARCHRWVYPRVCGGTSRPRRTPPPARGLSPRVRGNQPDGVVEPDGVGSIPACAGEPVSIISPMRPSWVYPRVCGGTEAVGAVVADGQGLSPRVRGNHTQAQTDVFGIGSIPACAGEP